MSCSIIFPDSIDVEKTKIEYFNGIQRKTFHQANSKSNKFHIKDSLYGFMGWVGISYTGDSILGKFENSYFVNPGNSTIEITKKDSGIEVFIKNSISIDAAGELDRAIFCKREFADMRAFYDKHFKDVMSNDSLRHLLIQKAELAGIKQYEYILKHPDLYYSFWLFHTAMINANCFHPDTLLVDYYKYFPKHFQRTAQGAAIVNILEGLSLKLSKKIAPNFAAKDIKGKHFELYEQKKDLVVLNFWASWCGPCWKEIEELKTIYSKYSNHRIKFVSVSIDDDIKAYLKASRKLNFPWINIYGSSSIQTQFAIGSIPRLLIIEHGNQIVFDSEFYPSEYRIEKLKDYFLKCCNIKP